MMATERTIEQQRLEALVRQAVRDFVAGRGAEACDDARLSELVRLTGALPLKNLAYWEQLIRGEHARVRREVQAPAYPQWLVRLVFKTSGARMPDADRLLVWLDVCSLDGFRRERALGALTAPAPNSFFLGLAVRRLNDWVPEVRRAARASVPLLARRSDPEHVVDVLCAMLPAWTAWGRVDPSERQALLDFLRLEQVALAMKRRIIAGPAGPLPAVLSQVLRTTALDEHLLDIATHAVQPAVRARAQRALLCGKVAWLEAKRWQWIDVRYCRARMQSVFGERSLTVNRSLLERLGEAAADRSPRVRGVAAETLLMEMDALGSSALPLVRQLARDQSPHIAERANFILQRLA